MSANTLDLQLGPRGDNRQRGSVSIKLWVIDRTTDASGEVVKYEVVGSVQRTVYHFASERGEFVRYENHYFPLHSSSAFLELASSVQKKIDFHNPYVCAPHIAITLTKAAPFIFLDEVGPLASIKL